jgi:hypothetical protein
MNRRTRMFVSLTACLALLILAGAGQAATPKRLLTKYQPVTYFTSNEDFRPTTVDSFVADATLERFSPACQCFVVVDPDPAVTSLPSSGAGWRLNQQPCSPVLGLEGEACYAAAWSSQDPPGTVYGRVARTEGKTVVQYWYFYYDDFYSYTSPPSDFIWQAHEGDWEVVNVVLDADENPLYVGYSQHCLGERRAWAKTPRWQGHHPLVYVARGSHANYFEPGVHAWNAACLPSSVLAFFAGAGLPLPDDYAEAGSVAGPAVLGAEATGIQRVTDSAPAWIGFPGTWGELQYLHAPAPIGTVVSGVSPVGPAQHAVWADPVGTLAAWPRG